MRVKKQKSFCKDLHHSTSRMKTLPADTVQTPQRNRPEINMAQKSPEMIQVIKDHLIHVFILEGYIPVQLLLLLLLDDAPRLRIRILSRCWVHVGSVLTFSIPKSCPFQLFPSVCSFWSVSMSSSNLYFQLSRSPILRSSCAHSTTVAFSFFAISDRRVDTFKCFNSVFLV